MNKQYLIYATPEDFTVSYSNGKWIAEDGEQFDGDETGPTDAWGSLPGRMVTVTTTTQETP